MLCKASGFRRRGPGRKLSGARPRRPARESCGWRLPESAQCLSVTGKYRDYLAAREQNDNLTFMGHRGTEGSRTPDGWQGQPTGRPRSYSASAALEPSDGDSGGPSRGPARGFPPAPGQPDPVYLHDDFDAWSDDSDDTDAGGQDGPHQDQWHAPAAGGQWDGAPVSEWESTGTHPGTGTGDWGEAGRTGEWAGSQTAEWARADEAGQRGADPGHWDQEEHWDQGEHWDQEHAGAQPWGEGSGHWDAPYGHWDENGEWHDPADHGGHDGPSYQGAPSYQDADGRPGGYDRAGFAIAGRDGTGAWDSAGYPDYRRDPESAEEDGGRGRQRRGGHGRKAAATPAATPAAAVAAASTARGRNGSSRKAARGSQSRTIAVAAAAVVVIAGVAAAAYLLLTRHPNHASAAKGSSPVTSAPKLPTPTASAASKLGKWGYITSRATDAAPLTVAELYPAQFLINGSSFVRATDRTDTDCNQGLFGTQLQNAAKVYGCSQVVRASYVSSDQTMMGTIGVVNLSSANDAAKAGSASGSNDFVAPLNGPTAPTKNLSHGTGVVQAEFKGHYLILIWAEFTNLKAPSTQAMRNQLEQF